MTCLGFFRTTLLRGFKGYGYRMCSFLFAKGNNFNNLLAILEEGAHTQGGLLLKEIICSNRSKFFPFRADPH